MVSFARVSNGAGSLDRLSTASTERVVRFVIVVATERLSIVYIKFLVWEWFLLQSVSKRHEDKIKGKRT